MDHWPEPTPYTNLIALHISLVLLEAVIVEIFSSALMQDAAHTPAHTTAPAMENRIGLGP